MIRTLLVLSVCSFTASGDVIVMKNGDRVTGSVIKKDAATLSIKSIHFGTVTLPWDQVESITTDVPLNAELTGGQIVQGPVKTVNGKVEVAGRSVAPADVKVLRDASEQKAYERQLNPGWTQLWAGTATVG